MKNLEMAQVRWLNGGFNRPVDGRSRMIDMFIALGMALVCIFFHFEAVLIIERWAGSMRSVRMSLLATWTGLFLAHIVEIWMYAAAYWGCSQAGLGGLQGVTSFMGYGYYSSVVYTTLGFGDILPDPGVHMLTGSEALVGLSLIAWSASITYGRVLLHQAGRE